MSNGTTTVLRGSIDMSLCPDTTPSSSAAMPEQSADVSSTPLHAHAVSWASTSSTTCRMCSTEQLLCLPVQTPKHTEISSQTDGRKNSRATHPAFFILMTRNRGDAYDFVLGRNFGMGLRPVPIVLLRRVARNLLRLWRMRWLGRI